MIAVDTSALMAIVLDEYEADRCSAALDRNTEIVISAGTLAEALIVAERRNAADEVMALVEKLGFQVAPVTQATAQRVAASYRRWGKGLNPAGLNFGDCFAYETARHQACPLLYVGDDFTKTNLEAAR